MKTPAYYDSVPTIMMMDPLASALGSAENGVLEYSYVDAVKLTGHSCPTVFSTPQKQFLRATCNRRNRPRAEIVNTF